MSGKYIMEVSGLFVLMLCAHKSSALLCYNCSSNHRGGEALCGGQFAAAPPFNNTRQFLLNCSGDNAMCFVRSWTARAKHAWIVQRGCYRVGSADPFPSSMDTPTRAMTCRLERLPEAEYRVCLCRADWCNTTPLYKDTFGRIAIMKIIFFLFSLYFLS